MKLRWGGRRRRSSKERILRIVVGVAKILLTLTKHRQRDVGEGWEGKFSCAVCAHGKQHFVLSRQKARMSSETEKYSRSHSRCTATAMATTVPRAEQTPGSRSKDNQLNQIRFFFFNECRARRVSLTASYRPFGSSTTSVWKFSADDGRWRTEWKSFDAADDICSTFCQANRWHAAFASFLIQSHNLECWIFAIYETRAFGSSSWFVAMLTSSTMREEGCDDDNFVWFFVCVFFFKSSRTKYDDFPLCLVMLNGMISTWDTHSSRWYLNNRSKLCRVDESSARTRLMEISCSPLSPISAVDNFLLRSSFQSDDGRSIESPLLLVIRLSPRHTFDSSQKWLEILSYMWRNWVSCFSVLFCEAIGDSITVSPLQMKGAEEVKLKFQI